MQAGTGGYMEKDRGRTKKHFREVAKMLDNVGNQHFSHNKQHLSQKPSQLS